MTKTKWNQLQVEEKAMKRLTEINEAKGYQLSEFLLTLLYNRGVRTEEDFAKYLNCDVKSEQSPYDMIDVEEAVAALIEALRTKKHIVVYADYDCDGVSAGTIAVKALRNLGGHVDYYINSRFVEGYGISPLGVDNMLKEFPTAEFVLTVDNGIVAYEGIRYAVEEKGLQVVVTDHHLAQAQLPTQALAVVNPHRLDDTSTFKDVCGATVIYKVMYALYWELGESLNYILNMVDLVGMATVGDVMPLEYENRYFVRRALELIDKGSREQFVVLKSKLNLSGNEEDFGFSIVPIVNSCGRLYGKPTLAMDFFLTTEKEEMEKLADELIETNKKRKELTTEQVNLAMAMVDESNLPTVIIVKNKDFHDGIVGLIAGQLKEKYQRPSIALKEESDGTLRGSARSVNVVPVKKLLDEVNQSTDTLVQYGGHTLAAGMTVGAGKFDDFNAEMNRIANTWVTEDDLIPTVQVDAVFHASDMTRKLVEELDQLRPYGQAFPKPCFQINGFEVNDVLYMGASKIHLRLTNKESGLQMVQFGHAEAYKQSGEPEIVQALGFPGLNFFRNKVTIQFMIAETNLRSQGGVRFPVR